MTKTCKQCPFLRTSIPGWLGDSTPEEFMETTMSDVHMLCHITINYEDPDWKEKWLSGQSGSHCSGSAVFFANICKLSRDRNRPRLQSDKRSVFSNLQEFLEHHTK